MPYLLKKLSTQKASRDLVPFLPRRYHLDSEINKNYSSFQFPDIEKKWGSIGSDFQSLWQFNNCLGAIDGKYVQIAKPANSGSYYFNYKGTFSIVILAIVNAKYEFMMVHTGTNGRISGGGVLQETAFYKKLINKKLNLPNPTTPEETDLQLPYAFVGDQAFSLMENLMKPYPDKNLTKEEKIFNCRLSRARRVVENAFGIMASVFRVFHSVISADVKHVDAIILACCTLHNLLRRHAPNRYMPPLHADSENTNTGEIIPGHWRAAGELMPLQRVPRASNISSREARENFKNYFNSVRAVPFQENMIHFEN